MTVIRYNIIRRIKYSMGADNDTCTRYPGTVYCTEYRITELRITDLQNYRIIRIRVVPGTAVLRVDLTRCIHWRHFDLLVAGTQEAGRRPDSSSNVAGWLAGWLAAWFSLVGPDSRVAAPSPSSQPLRATSSEQTGLGGTYLGHDLVCLLCALANCVGHGHCD